MVTPPILDNKRADAKSLFSPAALVREARRQKRLPDVSAPPICIFDPDGDLAGRLRRTGASKPFGSWPCYHTELDTFELAGRRVGIICRVVGVPFAVLVAEELFASGCRLLVSLTSAGQINPCGPPPYVVVIDRALRDEGASYHYAPPSEFADADPELMKTAAAALGEIGPRCVVGASWTTDAPFRETAEAIEAARDKGVLAVEMEAAALYAFARAEGVRVLCLAHVTNRMGLARRRLREGGRGWNQGCARRPRGDHRHPDTVGSGAGLRIRVNLT